MTPSPLPARRLPLLGCVLAVAAALALSACGDGGAATADGDGASQPKQQSKPRAARGQTCPTRVNAFVDSLDRLRRQLAIGLSYEQYAANVKGLGVAYDAIPVDHLAIDCLRATGSPSERAFDKYIDAANAWGECLADAACTTAAIEPVLQREWRAASGFLSAAQ